MNVRVCVRFNSPNKEHEQALRSLARSLTNEAKSVRVFAEKKPGELIAEFTMPTEPQDAAVGKIDRAIRFWAGDRLDSTIAFPKSAEERASAARKAARRRDRRRGSKEG